MSTKLELEAEIDELTEKLSEYRQTIDGHKMELDGREEIGYDQAMLEMEGKIENAFNAGFNTVCKPMNALKSWLNYKMEQRL